MAEAEAAVAKLDADRENPYFTRSPERHGNAVLEIDPYSDNYLSFDNRAIPDNRGDRHFGYARSNPQDHWAEFYSNAVYAPTQLYQDMVATPQAQVAAAIQAVNMAQARLAAADTSGARIASQKALAQLQQKLDSERATQTARQTQWNIMRNEIFHSDSVTTNAINGLQSLASSPGRQQRLAAFQAAAQQAATPEQIERLREQAEADMRAMP